jgi:hypothetical protein
MFKPKAHLEARIKDMATIGLSIGWFSGEPFKLFNLELLGWWEFAEGFTIVDLTIAKLTFHLSIY